MKDRGWCVNTALVTKAHCVVERRFGVLCAVERLKIATSNAEWRGAGASTPHVVLVHQPSRECLLLKGDSVSVLIALDLQATKLSSLLVATSHPKLSLEAFHELFADLKGRNRKKDVVEVDPPHGPIAVPFPLKGIAVVDEEFCTELFRVQ